MLGAAVLALEKAAVSSGYAALLMLTRP